MDVNNLHLLFNLTADDKHYFENGGPREGWSLNIVRRIIMERLILRQVFTDALAAGYLVTVLCGGEDEEVTKSDNLDDIMKSIMAGDDDQIEFYKPDQERRVGWIHAVYGNGGYDVLSDYTTNLDDLLKAANELADKLE